MGREINLITLILSITITVCFASISVEKQQKILNEYIIYLNSLPRQVYKYEAGEMLKVDRSENIANAYNVEMKIKATDLHNLDISRYLLCFATVTAADATQIAVKSSQCNYVSDKSHSTSEQAGITNMYTDDMPMVDQNGIDTDITYDTLTAASARKFHVLCEGCFGRINLRTPVVTDLTRLALNDLATHDPYTEHYLNDVLEVDHQVDSSRYILILNVTSDNCSTLPSQFCKNVKTCKVSILENIQTDHANGSKYINVVSNNCTRTTDLPYVNDIDTRITDTRLLYDKTHNILTHLYPDDDNFTNKQAAEKSLIEPHVKYLVQKSLSKYLQSVKNTHPHQVSKIENVTTQVSPGLMTQVTFIATPSSTPYLKYRLHCQSSVWGQFWISSGKHINVACQAVHTNSRFKRSVSKNGVTTSKDEAKALANKILKKYLKDRKVKVVYKVSKIKSYKSKKSLTSLDFEAKPVKDESKPNLMCNVVIKKPRKDKTKTHVSCFEIESYLPVEDDPNTKRFQDLMDASLKQYINTNKIKRKYCVLDRLISTEQVLKKKRKCVKDLVVKVYFRACPVSENSHTKRFPKILCYSEIFVEGTQHTQKVKKINITCVNLGKKKGDVVYKNPNRRYFKKLAKKSLKKYFKSHSIKQQYHKTDQIIVTKQVMKSKTITKIDFRAYADTDLITTHLLCHSEIESLKSQEKINVYCYLMGSRSVSTMSAINILAAIKSKSNDSKDYGTLADESLYVYIYTNNVSQFYIVQKINVRRDEKGKEARHINMAFVGTAPAKTAKDLICNSTITIYYSTRKKHFNVTCETVAYETGYVSPVIDEDPNKPPYPDLANQALKEYLKKEHIKQNFAVAERMIATSELTILKHRNIRMQFRAVPTNEKKSALTGLLCTMKMVSPKAVFYIECIHLLKGGFGIVVYEDPNKPQFKKLADKSLKFYLKSHKFRLNAYVGKVLIVTTQHVKGTKTKMDFRAFFKHKYLMTSHVHLLCHSEIFDGHPKSYIEVVCRFVIYPRSYNLPGLRQLAPTGEEVVKNPNESRYKRLAELSLKKCKNIKDVHNYYVSKRLKVTEQIVSGIITGIEFIATSVQGIGRLHCKSKIWEQAWLNKLDVNVTCKPSFAKNRVVRSISEIRQNNDIKMLSEESLKKYCIYKNITQPYRISDRNVITEQNITGTLTKINFTALPIENLISDRFRCHLRIWEQSINIKKDITFVCNIIKKAGAVQLLPGQYLNRPLTTKKVYIYRNYIREVEKNNLANDALKHIEAKYPNPKKQKVIRILSFERQQVAGFLYKIKLEVGSTDCIALSMADNCKLINYTDMNKFCRVNVWILPWTSKPPIYRVSCDYQEYATSDIYHDIQAQHLFADFLETYRPNYIDDHEATIKRFNIFKKNVRKIHELNIQEQGTAKYAVTKFTDLTYDEFREQFLGLNTNLRKVHKISTRSTNIPQIQLPDSYDWRHYNAVTKVKDQGSCGSCWAFSVTGNIEGLWKIHSGHLVSLSEQELVDCDKLDLGCNGGIPDNAYRALEQMGGLETEEDYPYQGDDNDKCSINGTRSKVRIKSAVNISTNETDIAKWLVKNGPISIAINSNAMQFYASGVSYPLKEFCKPTELDHGVLIVGYGIEEHPTFHQQLPYWTVKNSWGVGWGERGYYRVYRGGGVCGLNMMPTSAVL